MPTPNLYSPAYVLRQLLVDLGLASDPPSSVWPAFATSEPPTPDNCITTYDTAGQIHGRIQVDGSYEEYFGVQIRVRGAVDGEAYSKAGAIARALDTGVYDRHVTISPAIYLVHSISRSTAPISLGYDAPTSRRRLYTLNTLVCLTQTTP